MDSKKFITVLRQVIREEVQLAIRTELQVSQRLSERKIQPPVKYTTSLNTTIPKKVQAPAKDYSTNSILNSLLQQTADEPVGDDFMTLNESINYNDFDEWPTMQGGMRSNGGMNNFSARNINLPAHDTEGRPLNTAAIPDHVVNALNKDYSSILKKSKEISKNRIGV